MELVNLNSIFEILATITLAYILIDELLPNPFISLVTEKVLRRYSALEYRFTRMKDKVTFARISLSEIIKNAERLPEKDQGALKKYKLKLDNLLEDVTTQEELIKSKIRKDYHTRTFGFLNFYLFLFCLSMLFYGGVYELEKKQPQEEQALFHISVDSAVSCFVIISLVYLIFQWAIDIRKRPSEENGESVEDDDEDEYTPKVTPLTKGFNGYKVSFWIWALTFSISFLIFFLTPAWYNFQNRFLHNGLIIGCVVLPIANFLMYVIKAASRAKKTAPKVTRIAKEYSKSFDEQLKEINDFFGHCGHSTKNFEVAGNGSDQQPPRDVN